MKHLLASAALLATLTVTLSAQQPAAETPKRHNVIIFVSDGLRRGSVNATDMPTFLRVRTEGVDLRNSHSVFPTFTTANASAIATGHALGDTGDYSNVVWPGARLAKPGITSDPGTIVPFLESDEYLASMNAMFNGNYLGERTLLSVAREHGFNVASVGKGGPTAIQQNDAVSWDQLGSLDTQGALIIDDFTGSKGGFTLPQDITDAIRAAELPEDAPTRNNGYGETSQWNNGFSGDAQTEGTRDADRIQMQWMADVTTKVVLPKFAADSKPFVLLFWARDPDATQHYQGDSLQKLTPGINGETSKRALHNVDHCLKELLDWLDAHPAIKANTDVLLTSDHGFATVSRREISADASTSEPSSVLTYELTGKEKPEPPGTLPIGFLAVDLAIRQHLRVFDPAKRSVDGSSPYQEVLVGGEKSQHPSGGSALLGDDVANLNGTDAKLIVVANGGSDLIYVPSKSAAIVNETIATLTALDYVGGVFVDDDFCPNKVCPGGALPLRDISLYGASKLPRPAIVVALKHFYGAADDIQSGNQISDSTLQEGQGMHGGFARDQTWNNMAAIGPDFKHGFVDEVPLGNIDITPTFAHILGFEMPSVGKLKGRVMSEALATGKDTKPGEIKRTLSAPAANGLSTLLEYEEHDGVRYYDRACLVPKDFKGPCK